MALGSRNREDRQSMSPPMISPGRPYSLTVQEDSKPEMQPEQSPSPCTTQARSPAPNPGSNYQVSETTGTAIAHSGNDSSTTPKSTGEIETTASEAYGSDLLQGTRYSLCKTEETLDPSGGDVLIFTEEQPSLGAEQTQWSRVELYSSDGEVLQNVLEAMWSIDQCPSIAGSDRYDTYTPSLVFGTVSSGHSPPPTEQPLNHLGVLDPTVPPLLGWSPEIDDQDMAQQEVPWKTAHDQEIAATTVSEDMPYIKRSPTSYPLLLQMEEVQPQLQLQQDLDMSDSSGYPGIVSTTTTGCHFPSFATLAPATVAANTLPAANPSSSPPSLTFPYDTAPTPASQHTATLLPTTQEGTITLSEAGFHRVDSAAYKNELWYPNEIINSSPASIEQSSPGSRLDEPYARLIYKAFLSRPNRAMSLQEIYQWFRENTDKAKGEGKGWMNSIRHNLSMNLAFSKRNSKAAIRNEDGSLSFDVASDNRKSTEWYLEPQFYGGVESTTRYRRGNSANRTRGAARHSRGLRCGDNGHGCGSRSRGNQSSNARVTAGRKGGTVAALNRRRHAERQQQQQHARAVAAATRNPCRNLPIAEQGGEPIQYAEFAKPTGNFYPAEFHAQQYQQHQHSPQAYHPISSLLTTSGFHGNINEAINGVPWGPVGINYMSTCISDGTSAANDMWASNIEHTTITTATRIKPSQTPPDVGSDNIEPTTPPPGSILLETHRSEGLPWGSKHQQCLGSEIYSPLNYQPHHTSINDAAWGGEPSPPHAPAAVANAVAAAAPRSQGQSGTHSSTANVTDLYEQLPGVLAPYMFANEDDILIAGDVIPLRGWD